jgi:DNA-binding transcriptional regulator YhcF (GntR family)
METAGFFLRPKSVCQGRKSGEGAKCTIASARLEHGGASPVSFLARCRAKSSLSALDPHDQHALPYPCALCPDSRSDPPNTKTPDATLFSTRDISTNMTQINDAIAAIRVPPSGDKPSYRQAAIQFKVDRSTLRRRHKEGQTSVEAKNVRQRKLHPQQEAELIQYIRNLTKKALPPTRQMIQNFTSQIAGCDVSASWVTQFINRYRIDLITKWTTSMNCQRHQAVSCSNTTSTLTCYT